MMYFILLYILTTVTKESFCTSLHKRSETQRKRGKERIGQNNDSRKRRKPKSSFFGANSFKKATIHHSTTHLSKLYPPHTHIHKTLFHISKINNYKHFKSRRIQQNKLFLYDLGEKNDPGNQSHSITQSHTKIRFQR